MWQHIDGTLTASEHQEVLSFKQMGATVTSESSSYVISEYNDNIRLVRGHPFMTSTQRGRGGQAQVDACGRGRGESSLCGRPHKIKIRVH